ncbi:Endopolyphosphatase [Oleoguttula sp. CCFEE 5521]
MQPLVLWVAAVVAAASAVSVPSTQIPIVDLPVYSSTAEDAACHRGTGPAGLYGAETSECDSPFALVNQTFSWIEKEFRNDIDFIVWTGDSARHDNDEQHPRSVAQVAGLNEFLVQKMYESFGKRNGDGEDEDPNNDYVIPIIPTLGNNDVLPHNIMQRGPNQWTRAYTRMWRQFIPEAQTHSFEQGGWFYVEAIPGKLAVFSLNTLYFFTSNAAVDGCAARSEPGYRQMEWLRIQLQFMRDRGMKAILIGHVPPARTDAKTPWDETCWQKYTLWMQQYRDVVIAGLWGHMNYDHFFLQDFKAIDKDTLDGRMRTDSIEGQENDVHTAVSGEYFIDLREQWAKLPKPPKKSASGKGKKKGGKKNKKDRDKQRQRHKKYLENIGGVWAENYAVSFASASVVPNLLPVVRVFEYNTSGLDSVLSGPGSDTLADMNLEDDGGWMDAFRRKKPKSQKFTVPDPPSKSAPPGPAYSAQSLSLLGYTQYLANITHINNDFIGDDTSLSADLKLDVQKWKEGKHKGRKPRNKDQKPSPKEFKYEVHYDTRNDSVYHLKDLTMPHMLDLARRIGAFMPRDSVDDGHMDEENEVPETLSISHLKKGKKYRKKRKKKHRKHNHKYEKRNKAWYTFIRRAFVETMDEEDIEQNFGH